LLKLEIDTLHESWLGALKDELTKPEFLELKRFLKKEAESGKTIFPPSADVYSWYVYPTQPFEIVGTANSNYLIFPQVSPYTTR